MLGQVNKYLQKLLAQGLIESIRDAQLYGLDDDIYTRGDHVPGEVRTLFNGLNINSLLIARPEPIRWGICQELLRENASLISPTDTESLTFIHDIPVVDAFDALEVACALNRRKGCIVKDTGIVSIGSVSLEQAFIVFSSICFSTFVKFFSDILNGLYGFRGMARPPVKQIDSCLDLLSRLEPQILSNTLPLGTPQGEAGIIEAMDEAGKAVVASGMVDSFFGNISFREDDLIYISRSGTSLDELPGRIDCVPLDGSSTCEITSSSELSAHVRIYGLTGDTAILHGHPRFSVIMSMFGEPLLFGQKRLIGDVPVVAGEVGAGRRGLAHTVAQAMLENHCAVVYGHGTFASSKGSFHGAFERLSSIEMICFERFKKALGARL